MNDLIPKGISSPTPRVARIRSRVWAGLTPGKRVGRIYNSTRRLLDGGFSGLLDFVLQALRALRPCDPYNAALDSEKSNKYFWYFSSEYFSWSFWNQRSGVEELWILVVGLWTHKEDKTKATRYYISVMQNTGQAYRGGSWGTLSATTEGKRWVRWKKTILMVGQVKFVLTHNWNDGS